MPTSKKTLIKIEPDPTVILNTYYLFLESYDDNGSVKSTLKVDKITITFNILDPSELPVV